MRSVLRVTAVAALAVASLAGCVKFTSDTSVNADDTFSQVAVIATTEEARGQLESFAQLDLSDLSGTIKSSQGYLALAADYPDQISVESYSEGDLTGVKLTATNLPLSAFADSFAQLTEQLPVAADASITRTNDTYVVSIPAGEAAGMLAQAGVSAGQLELLGTSVDVSVSFSFPGLVTEATAGTIDGKTVTLGLADLATGEDITIVAGAADAMNWKPWLMWGGIALAALVILGGATALIVQDVRRHRSNKLPAPDAAAGKSASGPGVLIIGEDAPQAKPNAGQKPQ